MRLLLGIDIGTQGTKAAIFAEDGSCVADAFVPSRLQRREPETVEENPEWQFDAVIETIRQCLKSPLADAKNVAALAIAGQMAGVIGIGEDGHAVTPYDSWLDTRCAPYITRMQREAGDEIIVKTGNAASFNHGPKKLWWKHERPLDYARIRAFVQPGGYAAMRLCGLTGAQAFIDYTYLHFSGFADNRALEWDEALCERFGVDASKLPRIVKPQALVGQVTAEMAGRCGLIAGTPVAAGCGDTAASFLSCGATHEGVCVDVAGTASVFAATSRDFLADTKNRVLGCGRSVTPGLWHPYAYINGGGQNLVWFREQVLRDERSFSKLNSLAADDSADASLPYFVPHLGGRVSPGWPDLRGAWVGLSWYTDNMVMYRAMLEGVALEYGIYKKTLLELFPGFECTEMRVTGGGAKSKVWNRLKADRLQVRITDATGYGSAPMGAALLAGYAAGVFDDIPAAAAGWIKPGRSIDPDPAKAALSKTRIARYSALLESLHHWTAA